MEEDPMSNCSAPTNITRSKLAKIWKYCEFSAPVFGLATAMLLLASHPALALVSYLMGNCLSVWLRNGIEQISREVDEAILAKYHKWSVVFLNGFVGIGYFVHLSVLPLDKSALPLVLFGAFFGIYLMSRMTNFVQSQSFWAQFQSVLARLFLATLIAGAAWQWGYLIVPICFIPIVIIAYYNLRRDQRTYGWPDQ
jgi:hypothetical protein